MAQTYAIFATLAHFGRVVEEVSVRSGKSLQIGNSSAMAVPVPAGVPYLARVEWAGRDKATITDGRGETHVLTPDEDVTLSLRDLSVTVRMVPQFALQRTLPFPWQGSTVLFLLLLMSSAVFGQWRTVERNLCPWFGVNCPIPVNASNPIAGYEARYLERLLKKDYDGFEDGSLQRPEQTKHEKSEERVYLPAGNKGPITEMGGAEQVAPEPVRTPVMEEDLPPPAPKPQPLYAPDDVGTPLEQAPEEEAIADAGELEDENSDATDVLPDPPAEEKEGWGLPDWYDARDKRMEQFEIDMMLEAAKRRLRIDPDDPYALSILSYYQYLAEDYEAAEGTYDKYIALNPDESAGYNNKALVYKRRGEYEKEERLYRQALALDPGDPTALNNLAVCLSHQGRFEEALAIMEQLDEIDPEDPYADLHRSKIHAEMGNEDQALDYLEKALQGMKTLDTLHHIEFRQDLRVDPSFESLRQTYRFRAMLVEYYGKDTPVPG